MGLVWDWCGTGVGLVWDWYGTGVRGRYREVRQLCRRRVKASAVWPGPDFNSPRHPISGVIASVITHPIDTLKTCLQADMYGEVYQNIVQALFKLIREQGFASLFQGILPRTCMCILAFFVTTTLKAKSEQYKFVLQQREQRRKRKQSATLAIQG